ncbi:MAG: methyltransferase [Bacteroidetes bacterium]|jgi:chemotaxis protein methyltransferase CheR|nr:methyltransferase [Bacteroidota bacterium]
MSILDNVVSSSAAEASGLSQQAFNELRALIYDHTGIYFRDNKQYLLESQVGRRLKALNLTSYESYIELLQNGRRHSELPALVNAITINETFFFRHPKQYEAIVNDVLPALITKHNRSRVRIWSAACSTGDEPYTLALLINEMKRRRFSKVQFDIVGTDINTAVLDKARKGTYGSYAVRNTPDRFLNKYFRAEGNRYTLRRDVTDRVRFKHLNLTDPSAVRGLRAFDLILCANVLIYFDRDTKQAVISNLYERLRPGGYLFVGTSETLHGVTRALQPVRFNNTIAYQKEDRHGPK